MQAAWAAQAAQAQLPQRASAQAAAEARQLPDGTGKALGALLGDHQLLGLLLAVKQTAEEAVLFAERAGWAGVGSSSASG